MRGKRRGGEKAPEHACERRADDHRDRRLPRKAIRDPSDLGTSGPPVVDERAHHADAVVELRIAVVGRCRRELEAGVQVELVADVVARRAPACKRAALVGLDLLDDARRGLRVIGKRPAEMRLELGVAERHDAARQHARVRLDPLERARELFSIVHARAHDELRVHAQPGVQDALERLHAARGVGADELAARLGAHRVQRDVQGLQVVFDDALDVRIGQVGERDEVALQKRQAVVVVTYVERAAHVLGKHGQKAERAGVSAGEDAVEQDVVELEPPILAQVALEVGDLAGVERDLDLEAVGPPAPFDDVAQRHALDVREHHAGLEARLPCGRALVHRLDGGTARPAAHLRGRGLVLRELLGCRHARPYPASLLR